MVIKTSSEYTAGELISRVRYLQQALNQAEQIIHTFEKENELLKDALNSLALENKEGYALCSEVCNGQTYLL